MSEIVTHTSAVIVFLIKIFLLLPFPVHNGNICSIQRSFQITHSSLRLESKLNKVTNF